MQRKTLIALAVAGLMTAPLALAQYDKDRSASTPAPGSASTDTSSNVTGKANEDKGQPRSGAMSSGSGTSARAGGSISASEFRKMDKNNDGFLSKDEVEGNAGLSSNFDQLDANHDGKLARSEVSGSASASSSGTKGGGRIASNTNPDTSTRGGSAMGGSSDSHSNASNVSGSDVGNTPGKPGNSSPSAGR